MDMLSLVRQRVKVATRHYFFANSVPRSVALILLGFFANKVNCRPGP
jgi:hypothetical protein